MKWYNRGRSTAKYMHFFLCKHSFDTLSQKCKRMVYRLEKNGGGSVRVFRHLAIPALGTSPYTKDAAVNTEKSSVECTVNDDSVRTPRKNPSTSTNITLLVISVGKTKANCIICLKKSNGLRPLKARHAGLSIVGNTSLVVNEHM